MAQLAVLGGTFDPVHWGHLLIAETALHQVGLDQVIWVPVCRPHHKRGLAYEHRRLMVEKAIADNPDFVLSPVETNPTEPDYAIATLLALQEIYPNCQWYWIIGIDAFQTLPRWYRRERLIPACEWLVAPRSVAVTATASLFTHSDTVQMGGNPQGNWLCQQVAALLASQDIPIGWQLLQMPSIGISSSLIRQYCRQHRSIRYLVPEDVRAFITTHNLYSGGAGSGES